MTRPGVPWNRLIRRAALFGLLWVILVEATLSALPYGAAVVPAVTFLSWHLVPPARHRLRLAPLLSALPRFLYLIFLGGVDVARRALRPAMPIDPDLIDRPLRSPTLPHATAMAYLYTLQPGSLAVGVRGGCLRLHAINRTAPQPPTMPDIERRVAYGLNQEE